LLIVAALIQHNNNQTMVAHLFAEGATVAEEHVIGTGNSREDSELIVADAIAPNIQLEVD